MKHFFPKAGLMILAIMAASFSVSVQAEKKKVTWTTKWGKPEVAMMSPGVFGKDHILVQWERRDKVSSPDPEWDGAEHVYYEQADEVAGNAVVTGYAVLIFKNGDKAFHRLDGAYTGTYRPSGAWEGTAEGLYRFVGGTGKYKNIKGMAVVRCKGIDTFVAGEEEQDPGGCTMQGEVEY
jgi:hypothetical protein